MAKLMKRLVKTAARAGVRAGWNMYGDQIVDRARGMMDSDIGNSARNTISEHFNQARETVESTRLGSELSSALSSATSQMEGHDISGLIENLTEQGKAEIGSRLNLPPEITDPIGTFSLSDNANDILGEYRTQFEIPSLEDLGVSENPTPEDLGIHATTQDIMNALDRSGTVHIPESISQNPNVQAVGDRLLNGDKPTLSDAGINLPTASDLNINLPSLPFGS